MSKSYKSKKRKLFHSRESLELLKAQRKETQQETLDRIGYRKEEQYRDCISYLAW